MNKITKMGICPPSYSAILKSTTPREASITSSGNPSEQSPEDLLKSGPTTDKTRFYTKALILQRMSQQQPPYIPPRTNSMDFPELLKADKGIEELLYSFALIFSRDRPNHHDKKREYASGQVTACALRETPRAGGAADAKIYYLIVAKNDQFDMKDRKHMSEVGDWISGPNEIDDSIYQSLIGYLGNRVQSYLDSVSKELQHPTRSSKWSTEQFETVRSLYNVHNTFALPRASWTLEDRCASLRTAAEFVTHNQDRIERSFSSLRDHQDVVNRIWDKVERLSRVGLAIID